MTNELHAAYLRASAEERRAYWAMRANRTIENKAAYRAALEAMVDAGRLLRLPVEPATEVES